MTKTFDLIGLIILFYALLLAFGTIHLTGASVAIGLILSTCHLKITW